MNTVLIASFWAWTALVAIVLLLALHRLLITRGMYRALHVHHTEPPPIERIDYWGQILTVAAFILGMLLAVVYLYATVGPVAWPDPYPTC
jgi:hypothetical protein